MLSLPRHTLVLVLWVSLFFNIERLHVNKSELVNIAPPIYLLVAVLLVISLILPLWRRTSVVALLAIAFVSFAAIKLVYNRPYWGDAYTYLTLLELTAVLISTVLAYRVGRGLADFLETVRGLLLTDLDGRVYSPEQAEIIVKREMQAARRRNQPMSLLLVEADARAAKIELSATEREIQKLLTRRVGLITMTRFLAQNLRPSDSIVYDIEQGRWLLMTTEVQRSQASAILQRLNMQAFQRLGIKLNYGIASFPDQGINFEDLIGQAEQDLNADSDGRNSPVPHNPALIAEDQALKFSSSNPSRLHDDA